MSGKVAAADTGSAPGTGRPLRIFLSVGESSADLLGAGLMRALAEATGGRIEFAGVGGPRMVQAGLAPLYPMSDLEVMGLFPVLGRIGRLVMRWRQSLKAILAWSPDAVVIVDYQEFNHMLARAVRKRRPGLPIIDYVPPTIWAWRPGRGRTMAGYITHSLAVFPFEPEAHERLGAPGCTYVGHPLVERMDDFRKSAAATSGQPVVLVLPGSRRGEIGKMMPVFGAAAALISAAAPGCRFVIPAPDSVSAIVRDYAKNWPVPVEIVTGEAAKLAAMRQARAALAKSGTVTLELALARVPMVVGYRLDWFSAYFQWLLYAHSIVLPNLIVGRNAIPEFVHQDCTPEALAGALIPLVGDTPERATQLAVLDEVIERMRVPEATPSRRAANEVLRVVEQARRAGPPVSSAS